MTDEMTVQAQRPSALPYVLGGAALGGVAGAGSAAAGLGLKSPAYKSWEEAVEAVNKDDSFVKKQVEKGGDNKSNWEAIQTQAKAIQDAEKAVTDAKLPDGTSEEAKKAIEDFANKEAAHVDAEKKLLDKVKAHCKGLTLAEGYGIPPEVGEVPESIKTKYGITDGKISQENFRKLLDSTVEEEKSFAEKLLKQRAEFTGTFAEGATDAEKAVAKAEREAVTTAKTAMEQAKTTMEEKASGVSAEARKAFLDAKKGLVAAKDKAKNVLTEDLLGKCKKTSTWKTAAIGAAVLALAGLMIRPKGEEA